MRYLEGRRLELSNSSHKKECQLLVQPRRLFGAQSLHRISSENLIAFREWRAKSGVGPTIINMEMGVLRRLLTRAKRWHVIAADLKPLKQRGRIGRALLPEQKATLLRVAQRKPEWANARFAMTIALNTTMRGCEIKSLRWRDLDLLARTLTITKSKPTRGNA